MGLVDLAFLPMAGLPDRNELMAMCLVFCACTPPPPAAEAAPVPSEPPREVGGTPAVDLGPETKPDVFEMGSQRSVLLSQSYAQNLPTAVRVPEHSAKVLPLGKESLWVFLDQHAPRRSGARTLTLSDLHAEDEELAPGSHQLALVKEGPDSVGVQVHFFSVETDTVGLPLSPGCVLLTPLLTVNGEKAARDVRVLAVPLMEGVTHVRYRAQADSYNGEITAPVGAEVRLKSPPSGDIVLRASCLDGELVSAETSRTITVNRDAGAPEQ